MQIHKFLCVVLLCWASLANAQQKATLSGYIKDASNGEELIGVTVYVKEAKTGTTTNTYGFYSITLPAGDYTLIYTYMGYKGETKPISLTKSLDLNMELREDVQELGEVVVTGEAIDANVTDLQMSRNDIDIKQVKKLPALFGEPDIIKTVQMMPGVISAGEGTSAFFVRGGSADQNLILIDEAPIYDPSHLFGLFSVFNADVLKDSELYKGGIPSRFGGRLSSILEVHTKDGNSKELAGSAGIGSLASRIMVEGPIKKDKSSFIVSARRSYVDVFLRAANEDNLVHFYDINAKVNFKPSNKNRFFLAVYAGRDVFNFGDDFSFDWGNRTATFRWNHLFNDKFFSNTSVIASQFSYGLESQDAVDGFEWISDLTEFTIKQDMNWFLSASNELSFGYHLTLRQFAPGKISPKSENSIFQTTELQNLQALDHAFYLGNKHRISPKLTLAYGARLSIFQQVGETDIFGYENTNDGSVVRNDTTQFDNFENIKTYVNLEPRFSARYIINPKSSLKASYNRMVQNTHLVAAGTVPLPFNTWYPSGEYLRPQIADQVALGYFRNLKDNKYEVSAEAYYKDMDDVTDFADNADIFFNEDLANEFRQGKSWSYGAELMVRKNEGRLSGFASYTWSKTERKIPGVNNDAVFIANYDRRHNFNAVGTYELNDKWTFGGSFTYSTGRPLTVPSGRYEFVNYNVDLVTERNGFRMPATHRLDLSATLTPHKNRKKWNWSLVFSVYNVYSRKNPFSIYTRTQQDDDGDIIGDGTQKEARLIYLFPILPSVTYNVKF